jgi:hypothetical protein
LCTYTVTAAFQYVRWSDRAPSRSPMCNNGSSVTVGVAVGTLVFVVVGVADSVAVFVGVPAAGVLVGVGVDVGAGVFALVAVAVTVGVALSPLSARSAAFASISPQPYSGSQLVAPRSRAVDSM